MLLETLWILTCFLIKKIHLHVYNFCCLQFVTTQDRRKLGVKLQLFAIISIIMILYQLKLPRSVKGEQASGLGPIGRSWSREENRPFSGQQHQAQFGLNPALWKGENLLTTMMLSAPRMAGWRTNVKNSSTMAYGLWRIAGSSVFLSKGTILKSDTK